MKETPAENCLKAQALLGEGACWDPIKQCLYWLDILRAEVHLFDPVSKQDRIHQAPYHVTLVHPTHRGDLILGTQKGIARMDPDTGAFQAVVDPEDDLPGNRDLMTASPAHVGDSMPAQLLTMAPIKKPIYGALKPTSTTPSSSTKSATQMASVGHPTSKPSTGQIRKPAVSLPSITIAHQVT